MPISEIGTIGGLVEFLVDQGIKVGVAAELVAKAFGWGVDAAKFRSPENLVAPQIMIPPATGQLSLIEEVAPTKPRPKKDPAQVACRWPEEFTLGEVQIRFAADRGFNPIETQRMWEKFRDRNLARGEKYVGIRGWEAAWRTWVNNQVEFRNRDNQNRRPDQIDGRL